MPSVHYTSAMGQVRGIDQRRVSAWLAEHIEHAEPPFLFAPIEGGHSNLTYRVEGARGQVFVLRRPPLGSLLATAHDMAREHWIISSLAETEVPVAPTLALCEDETVNDAPFYVMAWVDGLVIEDADEAEQHLTAAARGVLSERVVEVLAKIHAVDPDQVGLGKLGRKEDYLARQLKRWGKQWEGSKTRELPQMEEVSSALHELLPEQIGASIVHGDYRIGNLLVSAKGHLNAVLDWELCTLGDPLADVGYILNNWAAPNEQLPGAAGRSLPPSAVPGFSSREAFLDRYALLTGRDVSSIPYYRAFQHWRSAAIVEGVLDRYLRGKMSGSIDTDLYGRRVEGLANAALGSIRTLS